MSATTTKTETTTKIVLKKQKTEEEKQAEFKVMDEINSKKYAKLNDDDREELDELAEQIVATRRAEFGIIKLQAKFLHTAREKCKKCNIKWEWYIAKKLQFMKLSKSTINRRVELFTDIDKCIEHFGEEIVDNCKTIKDLENLREQVSNEEIAAIDSDFERLLEIKRQKRAAKRKKNEANNPPPNNPPNEPNEANNLPNNPPNEPNEPPNNPPNNEENEPKKYKASVQFREVICDMKENEDLIVTEDEAYNYVITYIEKNNLSNKRNSKLIKKDKHLFALFNLHANEKLKYEDLNALILPHLEPIEEPKAQPQPQPQPQPKPKEEPKEEPTTTMQSAATPQATPQAVATPSGFNMVEKLLNSIIEKLQNDETEGFDIVLNLLFKAQEIYNNAKKSKETNEEILKLINEFEFKFNNNDNYDEAKKYYERMNELNENVVYQDASIQTKINSIKATITQWEEELVTENEAFENNKDDVEEVSDELAECQIDASSDESA